MKPPAIVSGESPPPPLILVFVLLIAAASLSMATAMNVTDHEIDGAMEALRTHNYSLFSNAIATSDLRFQLLSDGHNSFTLLSPRDGDLFRLGMSSASAADFVQTLRYHVLLRRLSAADLLHLSAADLRGGSRIPTFFLPRHGGPLIGLHRDFVNGMVEKYFTADGVRISFPNLFLGPSIAVHGLDGILSPKIEPEEDFSCGLGLLSKECVSPDEAPPPTTTEINLENQRRRKEKGNEVLGHDQESKHGNFLKLSRDFPL